jgi:hypothetical protein
MHDDFLDAGVRMFGVSVDSPGQQAAMIDKLQLGFPLLSDPDRSALISPLDLADPKDPREIAIPAMVLFGPEEQEEVWRFTSRDFADRMPEQEVLDRVQEKGWPSTTQGDPDLGPKEPGKNATPLDSLPSYYRGARFAALAMGLRYKDLGEEIKQDSKAYVAEMDRFIESVQKLQ